jgi:hypothetical protein
VAGDEILPATPANRKRINFTELSKRTGTRASSRDFTPSSPRFGRRNMHDHERFGHREHLQLAFTAIRAHGMPDAIGHVCATIREFATYQRVPGKYHHTVSQAWVEIVAHHLTADTGDFAAFIDRNPALLDKHLLRRHFSPALLASGSARDEWAEPDVAPFPWRETGSI